VDSSLIFLCRTTMLRNVFVQAFELNAENDLSGNTFEQLIIRRFAQFGPTMRDALREIMHFDGQIISPEVLSAIQDIMRYLIGRKAEERKSMGDTLALPAVAANPVQTTTTTNAAPGGRHMITDAEAEKLDKNDVLNWYSEYILDKLLATVDQAVRGKLDFKEHAVLFEQHFSVVCMTWRVSTRAPLYGPKLRDRLLSKTIVSSLVTLADTLPPYQVGRMPLKFLHMIVSYPKFPSTEFRADVVKDALGFPQVFASHLKEWVECFVGPDADETGEGAAGKAQLQAAAILDGAIAIMQKLYVACPEAAIAATRKAKLVDELFDFFPAVKRMDMLWPRILGCLMEVMSHDPRSEYVHLGLDMAQNLRRMKLAATSDLPGLFCLRVEGLRRLPRSSPADDESEVSPRRSLTGQLGVADKASQKRKTVIGEALRPTSPTSPKQADSSSPEKPRQSVRTQRMTVRESPMKS
jgi:hypothetical protein